MVVVEVVCFGDDSGVNMPCKCFVVALVCFEKRGGYPLLKHGYRVLHELRRMLGWKSGELKYRSVSRLASRLGISVEQILDLIERGSAAVGAVRLHSRGNALEERIGALNMLLEDIGFEKPMLVLDHGLVPCTESKASRLLGMHVRFASSSSTPGIQLSDIVAGACYHGLRCSIDECNV
ncbi:DUF3800 domain-containing protein [Pyrolobus fumarii]|uniref:DUF3800 domain-containing protein n=1 Tax=Pyrolobus fumarii TaxID=54252 RepID=UPI0031343E80